MKKLLLSVILFVALLAVPANAQLTNQRVEAKANGITWYMTGVADSMASLTSTAQSFIDYDNVDYYTIYYKFTAAVGAPKVFVNLYGSEDNSTFVLIEQIVDTTTSEAATYAATTLSYKRPKFMRLVVEQVATGRPITAIDIRIKSVAKKEG